MSEKSPETQKSTFEQIFSLYLSVAAKGVKDKTLDTYKQHFSAISKRLDATTPMQKLTSDDLDLLISRMREALARADPGFRDEVEMKLKTQQKQMLYLHDCGKYTVAQFGELCYNKQNMLKCNNCNHFASDPFVSAKIQD